MRVLECAAHRRDRPRGIRRLPVHSTDGHARRGADAQDRVARERLPCRVDPGGRSRRRDPDGGRAELSLAGLQRARRRLRPRPRSRARRHARRAARRRAAHARRARDGCRERSLARRGARAAAVTVRGADGNRRRPARRFPAGGDSHREPLVGRAALRLARPEPARREGALRSSRRAARHRARPLRARGGGGALRGADHRSGRLGSRDRRVRRGARAASRLDRRAARRGRSSHRGIACRRAVAVPARPRERRPAAG